MTISSLVLSDPDRGITSQVMPRPGVAFQGLSAAGTVRAVTESRQGGHGTRDTTASFDDAAVTLTLRLWQNTRALLDEFAAFLHPAARPVLVVTDTEWAQPRQLQLRFDSGNSPVELGVGQTRNVQYAWRAPAGVWEAAAQVSVNAPAIIEGDTGGLLWTTTGISWTTAGVLWVPGSAASPPQVISPGNVESEWQAILYGPATAPALANDVTGLTLQFTEDTTLAATDFILLDSATRSALLNGNPGSPVVGQIDFTAPSDWWRIQPGVNIIRYYPDSGSASTQAQVTFRPAWACS
jgi:hypothetical protein